MCLYVEWLIKERPGIKASKNLTFIDLATSLKANSYLSDASIEFANASRCFKPSGKMTVGTLPSFRLPRCRTIFFVKFFSCMNGYTFRNLFAKKSCSRWKHGLVECIFKLIWLQHRFGKCLKMFQIIRFANLCEHVWKYPHNNSMNFLI